MAGFKIQDFYQQAFERDFSRDYQLRVINIGGVVGPDDNVLLKATALPGYTINNIAVPFMGMQFNIPGSARFEGSDSWAVSFRCDLNFDIRGKFEEWQRLIFNAIEDPNITGSPGSTGAYNIPSVDQTIRLALHDRTGAFYRKYKLVGCYPRLIGPTTYNQADGTGQIVEIPVTLAYQWWELEENNLPVDNTLDSAGDFNETDI